MEYSDDDLLQLISPSFSLLDEITQREVYRSFHSLNYNMVLYIIQDYDLAQDVIQESFLKSLKKKPYTEDINHCKAHYSKCGIKLFAEVKKLLKES
ncbi:hypothetical protein [Paenibacillus azoreducens]|uniref:RNA polymerase sigma-70 region 2 domain-containing protein n=1 Tax=Paenibacillus azoreducens TaxID=116718 RepID=A0A920CRU2_9BACL|nr:hypothetical protein [Paenibacillus azoreducens]GIO51431.1 hypothetical protein J34TS1_61960 [Paenibacillus azoreducens]